MSTLPFDPERVAAVARARAEPLPIEGYYDDDPGPGDPDDMEGEEEYPSTNGNGNGGPTTTAEVVSFTPPQPAEGIIPLGYDSNTFFYLSRSTKQVHAMSPDQHTRKALMGMASIPYYWERTKFIQEKGGVAWDSAADWLMTECRGVGIYNPDRIRGRGAWFDQGRAVLHLGDRLLVDGRYTPLVLPNSTMIYPAARALALTNAAPLSTSDANQLTEIVSGLRWKRPISATLFCGWIMCAFVCGALRWRPSIWVDGSSGSGKSWCQDNILTPLVGPVALLVQSKTSEAGLRQTLKSDALPVIFDEFEREDSTAAVRVQGVLDLMRQSSSESEKKILKGSQNQHAAVAFRIRSCFAFSSINVGIAHAADESRVTVLSLLPPAPGGTEQGNADQKRFQALAERAATLITPEYAAGMLARAVSLLPTIRENAEVFAVAVASKLGTRRLGDQLGTLLAGAYSLYSPRPVTLDEAMAYIDRQDWGEVTASEQQKDEERLLSHITSHRVRFSQGNGSTMDITLGRLISASFGADDKIARDTADLELRDYGIRIEFTNRPWGAFVSTNHPSLGRILTGTPWATGWSRALGRLSGAKPTAPKSIRFGLGHVSKAVFLPLTTLDPSEEVT